ncbi:MAG: hypothetical protein QF437_05645 [Planctomycetota bacterium]|jgi:ferric-dicitrate binding protein FerR (iron transport regulator)|nr:hypothetical protein [Planctomycetota bacterium]MDP7129949.1 hypothetical protein [Planctomycetota bacterium]MDP7253328.1 hypothetical protein [Planctomycetota bacterium]
MRIPILVEPTAHNRFRATGCEPFADSVEADTPEAALEQMQEMIDRRISEGARIAAVELPDGANAWTEGAGMFRDDPLFDEWQQAIADYRREGNSNLDSP